MNNINEIFENTDNVSHRDQVAKITDEFEKQMLNKLSVYVSQLRKQKGLSIRELNARSHVSLAVINDVERVRSMPRVETLIRLALSLGSNVNELLETLKLPITQNFNEQEKAYNKVANLLATLGYDKYEVEDVLNFLDFLECKRNKKLKK